MASKRNRKQPGLAPASSTFATNILPMTAQDCAEFIDPIELPEALADGLSFFEFDPRDI